MTARQKGRIFISYRRVDSEGYAGRIYDRLAPHFGDDAIFMDVDDIPAGVDFVKFLENEVRSCDVLIALIGRQWLNVKDEHGERRLDNPEDFVRIEIATALERDIRVIPILLGGVGMPQVVDLPENLKPLSRRNNATVNHASFHRDMVRLIRELEGALEKVEESKTLKAQQVKEELVRKERQAQVDKLHYQANIAINLQDWELAKHKLWEILIRDTENVEASAKLEVVEKKLFEYLGEIEKERKEREAAEKTEQERVFREKQEAEEKERVEKESQERANNPARIDWAKNYSGKFMLGSDEFRDEKPPFMTYLDTFLVSKTLVTNAQFSGFVAINGYMKKEFWSDAGWEWRSHNKYIQPKFWEDQNWNLTNHPVVGVSWYEAEAFCNWAQCRLLTEAEWEKTARGANGNKYPWGNKMPNNSLANFGFSFGKTTPVGMFSPKGDSPCKCADMVGNVFEWVADWYDQSYYENSPARNPLGPLTGSRRSIRGGAWNSNEVYLRTSGRDSLPPEVRQNNLGFRCAMDAE